MIKILSLLFLISCQTTVEEKVCPVCVDSSIAEQEMCDIEKAELVKKHEDCLDAYYRSELKCKKLKKGKKK